MGARAKQDTTYNGFSNYETWAVNLWLTNDESSYKLWRKRARETLAQLRRQRVIQSSHPARAAELEETAALTLAGDLKGELLAELESHVLNNSLAHDLLGSALGAVNWLEIARSWLEGVDQ